MPFTFSHPAIVIPFYRYAQKYFSFTGLIAGTIVPDFEFLFQLKETHNLAHHFPGYLWFNIPIAFICCFVYNQLLRVHFIENLPLLFQKRLYPFIKFDFLSYCKHNWLKVFYSIVVGIFLHLFWDAFTHDNGFFVLQFSVLKKHFNFAGITIPVFSFLQIVFSVWGLYYILRYIFQLKPASPYTIKSAPDWKFWAIFILLAIVIFIVRYFAMPQYRSPNDIIIAVVGSVLYAFLLIPVYGKQPQKHRDKNLSQLPHET